MKYTEIALLTNAELNKVTKEERLQLTKMRFNHAVANLENPTKIRTQRRVIAMLLTEGTKRRQAVLVANITETATA
ncbi:MAG: 50S ribosomal protein L29 [Flavobacteriaceae bacterium]|nr:50S ribosomal protein L29 [Flavobacteriaceae bacterium]